MNRHLYRCYHDRRIAGVASGLAEYFDVDPTIVRLLWVISVFFGGVGVLLYIAMAIDRADGAGNERRRRDGDRRDDRRRVRPLPRRLAAAAGPRIATPRAAAAGRRPTSGSSWSLFGALALVDAFLPAWADGGRFLWPAFIVGIGALLVATAVRREPNGS